MKSTEIGVLEISELYFYSPSQTARKLYFYLISAGHFFCVKNYHLIRSDYASLLITHIINGSFTYVKDGKHVTARAGDTVILDCYKDHEYYTNDSFESIWVHVSGGNNLELYHEIERVYGNVVRTSDPGHIQSLLFRLFDGISGQKAATEQELSLDLYKLFMELLSAERGCSKQSDRNEELLETIKSYILEHISEPLTVQCLAEQAHMSVSHFSRVFKQQTHISPYEFILLTRLSKAKELLRQTDRSIGQIAFDTGFNSESNFIHFFTANTNLSPRKFRMLQF